MRVSDEKLRLEIKAYHMTGNGNSRIVERFEEILELRAELARLKAAPDAIGVVERLLAVWLAKYRRHNGKDVSTFASRVTAAEEILLALRSLPTKEPARPVEGAVPKRAPTVPCPLCGRQFHARVEEQKSDGTFARGPNLRCVDCKEVFRDPTLTQAADGAVAVVERLRAKYARDERYPDDGFSWARRQAADEILKALAALRTTDGGVTK